MYFLCNTILIIDVGNRYRSDDGIGLAIARRLKDKALSNVTIAEVNGEGAGLLETWQASSVVIVIAAVSSGAEAGTLYRFDVTSQPIPARLFRSSSHAFSVAEAVELARELDQLPSRLIVHGIEGKTFSVGESLSPEVAKASEKLIDRIVHEVQALNTFSWRRASRSQQ